LSPHFFKDITEFQTVLALILGADGRFNGDKNYVLIFAKCEIWRWSPMTTVIDLNMTQRQFLLSGAKLRVHYLRLMTTVIDLNVT
jgi:hypothetical protein